MSGPLTVKISQIANRMARGSQKFEAMACGCELNFQWHTGERQLF
jgi:hypothetical protein